MLKPLAPAESELFWYETHRDPSPKTTESGDEEETAPPDANTVGVIDAAFALSVNIAVKRKNVLKSVLVVLSRMTGE